MKRKETNIERYKTNERTAVKSKQTTVAGSTGIRLHNGQKVFVEQKRNV